MYPIITISREFGSGGHSVGQKVAEELGIPFYDSELVDQVAKRSGYTKAVINEQGEYTDKMSKWFSVSMAPAMYFENPQDEIFKAQKRVILDCAEEGPCVIVGRCADYILDQEAYPTLNVFIHADMPHRISRVLERYGDTEVDVRKRLERKDRNRKTYYRYYTGNGGNIRIIRLILTVDISVLTSVYGLLWTQSGRWIVEMTRQNRKQTRKTKHKHEYYNQKE